MENKEISRYYLKGVSGLKYGFIYSKKEHDAVQELVKKFPLEYEEIINYKKPFEYQNKLDWCPDIKGFCVYVLMCDNGQMYKGFTEHFKNRMLAHFNFGGSVFTKKHKPLYIVHHEEYDSRETALAREKFFKTTQGRNWIKNSTVLKTLKPF